MPELADRHCVPILHYRKSAALAAVRSCHLLVRREHAARGADAGRTDSSGPLGCSGNVTEGQDILLAQQADLLSFLSEAFLCHKRTLAKPPAVFNHNSVLPKVKCLTQEDIGDISS